MLDFSSAGWKEALLKVLKVALWVALSGAISALITWLKGVEIPVDAYWFGLLILGVNSVLAGLLKWLGTKSTDL
jgi:hypothetical protein